MPAPLLSFTVPGFRCGACLATFPGRLSRCPECGIQLLSSKETDEDVPAEEPGVRCQRCGSGRVAETSGKCSDSCYFSVPEDGFLQEDGYVPGVIGDGSGDYMTFSFCLDCGQMQGEWPVPR